MGDAEAIDLALLVFRCGIGAVMLAHGINHIWGGGKIEGTAGWFGSMGMRPPLVQAWLASLTEIVGGALLVLGLLSPFGGAAVVGTMTVAFVINHRGNGFFIFRPGEGWEYVMTLGLTGMVLGAVGPGSWSLDDALDIRADLIGWTGLAISVGAGVGGAALLLATCWRPPAAPDG
ncbi:putative oxidoreductase [Ilumatobacter fluminis]|uniref:Putative oxidoreductase n=1 Tax=Ilumatobacter fluminis TaxID=467091 RepID=A0A4V3EJH6_9ACTN|nr:DoxX family protein [Ilumatobacter fluminis]TDT17188.1 putative oxidoreductase [Ilumatobacter fluminis]